MNPNIFREYDIRGQVPEDLNQETVYRLALALGTYYGNQGVSRVSVGRDCRLSSPDLMDALQVGLRETGTHVLDVGMVPTPLLYFSLFHQNLDGGVQITGSHNPPDQNGLKICLGKSTIYGSEIQKLREIVASERFAKGRGRLNDTDVLAPYLEFVQKGLRPGDLERKVVIDAGNGVGGMVAPELYAGMGVGVEELYCEPDGHFPNHHPDPTLPEYLENLVSKVAETGADLGIAFDGDADRIGVVDPEGRIIWGDQLMIIFSRDLLKQHPGAKIIGEVKCSQTLYDDIAGHGGQPVMWKAGHSLIKGKMREEGALLAGEMSGHLFFADRYYGYDDAIYAGARLLEILTRDKGGVRDLLVDVPNMCSTPEIRLDCPDEEKFRVVAALAADFKRDYDVIDVDGVRVLFDGGWGLVRASNTQPVLVLRFEAEDEKRLEEIQKIFMDKVKEKI